VIRFTNPEIDRYFESVCLRIDRVIRYRTAKETLTASELQEIEEEVF
jgi:hypothetical protein